MEAHSDAEVDAKDSKTAETKPGLFVIVFNSPYGGAQLVELHGEETAASRVSALTYGSKQHRKEAEEAEETLPDGGGNTEINRRDIHVYRLGATEVTDF
jgi:hypothetical protein